MTTPEQEKEYWKRMVEELRLVLLVAQIAEAVGVEDRQVFRWLEGDRPKGLTALRVYMLHVKHCPLGQWRAGHSQEPQES